jgi:hypothetical protein
MCLVNHNVLPNELLQHTRAFQDHFVASDDGIKVLCHNLVRDDLIALILGTDQNNSIKSWTPLREFILPIAQRRFWHNDKEWSIDLFVVLHVAEQRNGLESLSQAL